MTSSIDDSPGSSSLSEEMAVLLDGGGKNKPDEFETLLEQIKNHPARDVVSAVESAIEEDRDRLDTLPQLLDEVNIKHYLDDGSDTQRTFLATVQRLVVKHHPNRRKELIPVLVDGLSDPARREQSAQVLEDICGYTISIARKTIDELENAPSSLYSDPAAVDAVADVVSSIENSFHRFKGEVELPAVARLQVGTEQETAKRELVKRAGRSASEADEIVESVVQLLDTVDDGRETRQSRRKAREIIFEIAIKSPESVAPHADRLIDASGIDDETVVNAYVRILDTDVDTAEELFAAVAADAAEQNDPDQRVDAIASLLAGAPPRVVTAIMEEVREGALDPPPVQDETAEQLYDDSHCLLALLWTDATAPIGKQLVAMQLKEGADRLARDIATVVRESPHGLLANNLSEALERTDILPDSVVDELASGIADYLQRSNASAKIAAKLAAPVPAIGQGVFDRVLAAPDPRDEDSPVSADTFRDCVEHIVEINPAVVAKRCVSLIAYAVEGTPQTEVLNSIGEALERADTADIEDDTAGLTMAVDLLGHENDDVVVHGCRLVAHLEPYPAPQKLLELKSEADGRVERLAEWAVEYIDDASRGLETELLDAPDNLKPSLQHLAKQDVVKYRSSNEWDALRLGPLEVDILNSIAAYYNRGRSAVVTHPAHDSRVTLLYAVALLCEGAVDGEAPTVGIASPVYGHKERWGTFGDIETEYQKYGISDEEGSTIRAVTFDDLFGTAKVSDGELSVDRRGDRAGQLVLTKSIDNLSQVTDELTAVIVQAVERFKIPLSELSDRINDDFGDTPVFPIYSATTKQDTGGVADIAPPSQSEEAKIDVASTEASLGKIGEKLPNVDAVRKAAQSMVDEDDGEPLDQLNPPIRGALQAAGYTWPKEITVRAVGSEDLRESMDEALDIGFDLDTGSSKMLGTAFRFERLPVHASDFDVWVEEKGTVNPRSRVDTFGDQLDDIEDSTDRDHISSNTTIAVREGVKSLDSVNDTVQDSNPLFERLQSRLEETIDDAEQVGVVVASQSYADVLSEVLVETLDATIGEDVVILTPEKVSSVLVLDRLFVVGPQRPAHAAVYFPSCTSQVEVLTIGTFWENYIEKHTSRYRDELAEGLAVDSESLGQLSITTEDETTGVEEPEPRPTEAAAGTSAASDTATDASEPAASGREAFGAVGGGGEAGSGTWLPGSLTEVFERAAEVEGEHGSGEDSYGSSPTYEVRTESGETVQLGRGEAIYRIENRPSGESYSWTAPSDVESGDEILVVDPSFFGPRRDEWLQRQYEQQFDDPEAVFQGLFKWWTAMNETLHQLDDETGPGGSVLQAFYDAVSDAGVDKHKQAVRLWIEAIEETGEAIELPTADATIGPDSAADIEAVGRAFEKQELAEDAEEIQEAMDEVRKFNAIGGRQYREIIEDRLEEGHPEFRKAATPYAVVEARKLDEDE